MNWGVVCSGHTKRGIALTDEIITFLKDYGTVYPEKTIAKNISDQGYSFSELNKHCDIVVTIGGDGTIIRTLSEVEKPLFTINSGGMGFLSEVESKFALQGLKQVIDGSYIIEERAKLCVDINGQETLPDVINEVTLQTARIAKIMYVLENNQLQENWPIN